MPSIRPISGRVTRSCAGSRDPATPTCPELTAIAEADALGRVGNVPRTQFLYRARYGAGGTERFQRRHLHRIGIEAAHIHAQVHSSKNMAVQEQIKRQARHLSGTARKSAQ